MRPREAWVQGPGRPVEVWGGETCRKDRADSVVVDGECGALP